MALVVKDRVRETSSSTGTGTITLNGAVSGFQSFSVIGNSNTTYYAIVDSATGAWEVGIGTYTLSGTTLSRDTILESSTGGTAVSFAAGTKDVFCTYPAEKAVLLDANNALFPANDLPAIISVNTATNALRITQTGAGNALLVEDEANPDATPFVINNSGAALVGVDTTRTLFTAYTPILQVEGTTSSTFSQSITANINTSASPVMFFAKSRGTTNGSNTIVSANDTLGVISFNGADGTDIQTAAAQISAAVDGTPGANDMPGRLVFSTTADGASTSTERMRIDSAGRVGIGASTVASIFVNIGPTLTGATTVVGVRAINTIASDVTSLAAIFRTQPFTQAAAFTLPNLYHYEALQGTIGATSAVTNQYGFVAGSSLIGATNNYGFFSNIASAAGRFNFYAAGTAANVFIGTTSIGGIVGAESLRVTPVASAVNYFTITGNATGGGPGLTAAGSDTNISTNFVTKGTGNHVFYTNGSAPQLVIAHTASAVNYLTTTGQATGASPQIYAAGSDANVGINLATKGTGGYGFFTNTFAQQQFSVAHTASAVNYLQVTGAATGAAPSITATGSDANIGIRYIAKTAANHQFQTGGSAVNQFVVQHQASAVNYLQVAGAATGNAATLSAQGSDANIDIALTPKGTGGVEFTGPLLPNNLAGTAGQVLTSAGAGVVPTWTTPTTGTITSVGGTGTVNGLTLTGTVTSSGNLTLGGTLDLSAPPAIGAVTPSTGKFSNLEYTGTFTGGTGIIDIGTNQIYKDAAGLVGIGKVPVAQLDVNGSIHGSTIIRSTDGGSAATPSFQPGNDNDTGMFWGGANIVGFTTAGTERARIGATGIVSLGATVGAESLRATPVTSSVNYINASGAATTAAPSLAAAGSDANIDLTLSAKGTGNVRFGTYTAGVVTQAGYITIKDAGGTTRRLLVG